MDIIALEIGNTSVSLAVAEGGEVVLSMHFPAEALERCPHLLLDAFAPYAAKEIYCSSVAPSKSAKIVSFLEDKGYAIFHVTPAVIEGHLPIDVEEGVEVGVDLLLDAFAVKEPSAIVLDLGTCNKMVFKNDGAFAGVAIAPGFAMGAEAIFQGAELVPSPGELPLPSSPVGKSTPDALSSGLLLLPALGFAAMADSFDPERKLPRYLTGGGAARLASLFPGFVYEPDLALRGLLALASSNK